jgi:hypothetical protein
MQDVDSARNRESVPSVQGSPDALVNRVASSPAFQKSNRLRQLLLFLCERTLSDPALVVHESDIGIEVFGRQPGYDTAQDPLVRVQVSQLRKKLEQYFASEGRHEPVVIEIPKGAYTPVFYARKAEAAAEPSVEPRVPLWSRVNRLTLLFACLTVLSAAVAVWALLRPLHPLRAPAHRLTEWGPTVDRLWDRMFGNGRPACVVLSDASLVVFEETLKYQLSLTDYRNKDFDRIADTRLSDPKERTAAKMVQYRYSTHVADTQLASAFSVLNAIHQVPTDVLSTRDFAANYLNSHNVILLGSRRGNPWVELFEGQLNFRTVFLDDGAPVCYFQNQSPLPEESASYRVDWGRRSYCRVAFLPTPTGAGSVLLISGTDMASTEAGGQFISSERWIRALQSALKLNDKAQFPHFEVLLKVEYVTANTAPNFTLVAARLRKG